MYEETNPRYAKKQHGFKSFPGDIPPQVHVCAKIIRPRQDQSIHPTALTLAAPLFFATSAVPVAPPATTTAVAVQLVPQAYPLGQQPPPCPLAQLNQPCAHPLAPNPTAAPPDPLGTATVTPFEFKARVEDAVGQEVRPQSRPTRQQPA